MFVGSRWEDVAVGRGSLNDSGRLAESELTGAQITSGALGPCSQMSSGFIASRAPIACRCEGEDRAGRESPSSWVVVLEVAYRDVSPNKD